MKIVGNKPDALVPFLDVKEAVRRALTSYPSAQSPSTDAKDPFSYDRLQEIKGLWRRATEGDFDERLIAVLKLPVEHREEIEQLIVAWIGLVEVLVSNTESRYKGRGRGALKSREVKAVVLYLFRAQRFSLPGVPDFLEPVVIDVAAGWTATGICELANRHGVYVDMTKRRSLREILLWPLHLLGRCLQPLLKPLARLVTAVWLRLRFPAPLSPAIRSALREVERTSPIAQQREAVDQIAELIVSATRDTGALRAGIELVSIVVEETEKVVKGDGAAKKVYATRLIFAVLEDMDMPPGLVKSTIINIIVSASIDAVVHMYNKWQVFPDGASGQRPPRRRVVIRRRRGTARP